MSGRLSHRGLRRFCLGDLIEALQQVPFDLPVVYDFCAFIPTRLASFSHFPEQVALGYAHPSKSKRPTVGELLAACSDALISPLPGRNHVMTESTPLWIANPGEAMASMVVGLSDVGRGVILETSFCS